MSNWGFESPEEQSKLLKLDNFLYIHAKKWKIGNDPWCVLTQISQLLHGQNWKSRTVSKSSGPADFKTDLTFWIWWRFKRDIDTLYYTAIIHKYGYGKSSKCGGSGWKVPQIVTYISENILMTSSASMTGAEAGRW